MNSESWRYSTGNQLELHHARHYRDNNHRLIVQLPDLDNLVEVRIIDVLPHGELVKLFNTQSCWSMWFPCDSVYVLSSIKPPPKPKPRRIRRPKKTSSGWIQLADKPEAEEGKKLTREMLERIYRDMMEGPHEPPDEE